MIDQALEQVSGRSDEFQHRNDFEQSEVARDSSSSDVEVIPQSNSPIGNLEAQSNSPHENLEFSQEDQEL